MHFCIFANVIRSHVSCKSQVSSHFSHRAILCYCIVLQSFTAKVESGSSVNFTWVIDNLEQFAFEGESYSVAFKKPAEYKLRVRHFIVFMMLNLLLLLMCD